MTRKSLFMLAPLGAVLLLPLAWRKPAPMGAPWISIEIPANPMDPAARDAVLLVHTYYHGTQVNYPVSGTAEGLVDGKRRSLPLEFTETSRLGVYALKQQWPAEGDWVLALTANGGADVSLVAELGPNGGVETDRYYNERTKVLALSSVRVVPGAVPAARVDARLKAMALRSGG